jgi:hypothetical protein
VWIELNDERDIVLLHQKQFCEKICDKFRDLYFMFKTPKQTPLPYDIMATLASGSMPLTSPNKFYEWWRSFPYLEVIGSILYLALNTRPDIMFAVCMLARYAREKTHGACLALAHLLSYLSGTTHYGINYTMPTTESTVFDDWIDIYGMSDADWASCLRSRRSTAGYMIFAMGGPLAWGSKLMATIATSSMEAEYMAAYYLGQALLLLRRIMKEITLPLEKPSYFFMDAMAAINGLKNNSVQARTKHIDVKWRWLAQYMGNESESEKCFNIVHIRSIDLTTDLMTKHALRKVWDTLIEHLMGWQCRSSKELIEAQKRPKDTEYPQK